MKEYIGINQKLKAKRRELEYSSKEASVLLHISRFKLLSIENGFIYPKKKEIDRFIKVYKLDESFFEDELKYPTFKKKIEKEKKDRFKFLYKKRFLTFCLCLLVLSIPGIIVSTVYNTYPITHATNIYTKELINFQKKHTSIKESSQYDPIKFDYMNTVTNSNNPSREINLKITGYQEEANIADFTFTTEEIDTTRIGKFSYTSLISYFIAEASFKNNDYLYNAVLAFRKGRVDFISGSRKENIYGNLVYIDINNDENKWVRDEFTSIHNKNEIAINSLLSDPSKYNSSYDFMSLGVDICNGNVICMDCMVGGYIGTIISSLILILFTPVTIASFILIIKKKKKVKLEEKKEEIIDVPINENKKEDIKPNNLKIPLIFRETLIRIIGLVTLFLCSFTLYFLLGTTFGTFKIMSIQDAYKLQRYGAALIVIPLILLFFTKLDFMQKKSGKELARSCFMFFILGVAYYIAEVLLIVDVSQGNDLLSVIGTIFSNFLPGNIFFGIGIFQLFTLFLFSTPKWCNTKNKITFFRFLALLPFLYTLISILYPIAVSYWGLTPWSIWLRYLLFNKSFVTLIFAFLFTFTIFLYEKHIKKKYKDNIDLYMNGRRYMFNKNIITCCIILFIAILDFTVGYFNIENPLKLGGNWILIVLIPFILFYHHTIGKRNKTWDLTYSVLYAFAYGSSYILIGLDIFRVLTPFIFY